MKKIKMMILMMIGLTTSLFSQTNFKWDIVSDSLKDNKSQLYSKTKLFISETWNSAQDVIQNDDKENGVFLVKGINVQNLYYQMNNHRWTFNYTIKFLMKDNKCRIVIEDVYCSDAVCYTYAFSREWPHMPVSDTYPTSKGISITGVNEERYLIIMTSLKNDLQSIVDLYQSAIKTSLDNGW